MRTIRDVLIRKRRTGLLALYLPLAVIAAAHVLGDGLPPDKQVDIVLFAGLFFVGAGLAQYYWSRCPKCSRALDPQLRFKYFGPINYCPYCGVSLDSETPH
jgi:hypothetical protein